MKREKRIHQGYKEWEAVPIHNRTGIMSNPIFDKWQYIFSDDKGNEISMIHFLRLYDEAPWEIYQIKGEKQLFEDVERYKTRFTAEARCLELLG